MTDGVHGESITYAYDDLDRLTLASSPVSESYSYDEIGNITMKNGLPYAYSAPAHVHAVTSFGGVDYSYDENGSMVARGSYSVRYDPERRPARVSHGGATLWRAVYDGDGVRRKRIDDAGTIHYVGPYERSVGNGRDTTEVVTKYYHALGRLVAYRRDGELRWVGTDHLGERWWWLTAPSRPLTG